MTDGPGSQLNGKVAAVTGATSGSGRAIASRFVAEGADVVLLARGEERLREMEDRLGHRAVGISMNVSDPSSVEQAFAKIRARFGKLDILINNAALHLTCAFDEMHVDQVMAMVHTNFMGPIWTSQAAIPLMREAGGGDIVNTSSEVTFEFFPMMSIYVATKAALESLSNQLRMEYEVEEIRTTTLIQGVALGEGGGSLDWAFAPGFENDNNKVIEMLARDGSIRRCAGVHGGQNVDDVAEAHLFVVTRPRGQKIDVIRVRSY